MTEQTRRHRGKSQASLDLIQTAHDIAAELQPITVRGICYRLFVRGLSPDMSTKSTKKVSQQLTDARKRNICGWGDDWQWIVDETREAERTAQWRDPQSLIDSAVRHYRRDNWRDQPVDVELWSEKGTVRGICAPVLKEFGITFRVMHGFSSFTAVKQVLAERVDAKPLVALYVGDHDPSGRCMSDSDLPARLREYDLEDESDIELIRIALVEDDLRNPDGSDKVPGFPAGDKRKDSRYPWFVEHHGHRCWELDAMDMNDLRSRITAEVKARMNLAAWEHSLMIERAEVESMQVYPAAYRAVARHYRRHGRPGANRD
jgi:hypothetical protein